MKEIAALPLDVSGLFGGNGGLGGGGGGWYCSSRQGSPAYPCFHTSGKKQSFVITTVRQQHAATPCNPQPNSGRRAAAVVALWVPPPNYYTPGKSFNPDLLTAILNNFRFRLACQWYRNYQAAERAAPRTPMSSPCRCAPPRALVGP